ncbi:MAG TPA: M12 family metallopeptidase [Opitutaceae bacterium]|nr:M12 family metallopeptidase [Opitutaceae bacterium]
MSAKSNSRKDLETSLGTSSTGAQLTCTPKRLPEHLWERAARNAIKIEPRNFARAERLVRLTPEATPTALRIAAITDRKWPVSGVKLTVGFLDNPEAALRKRILLHMNAWGKTANVRFVESKTNPQVRIAREGGANGGYWSYLGTEILEIPKGQQTMNLEAFTMQTPESEFHRVVRHETGHTLGFPHEHMRKELVKLIDPKKAIAYFGETQGWSPEEVRQQVLTPLDDKTLIATAHADENSIMCYQIPGVVTKSGKPILGGLDIDASDYAFAAQLYPKPSKMKHHA